MFRKNFRRRLVLGLAFAALAAPASAQASTGYFVDGGAPPVSNVSVSSSQPAYLRYHQVGVPAAPVSQARSENSSITPLQADALRWQAMADAYKQRQQPQLGIAFSERSFGVPGPDPSLVPQVTVSASTSNGFDWSDAGIGASTGLIVAALLLAGIVFIRRNQHSGLTSA